VTSIYKATCKTGTGFGNFQNWKNLTNPVKLGPFFLNPGSFALVFVADGDRDLTLDVLLLPIDDEE